ncbi:MAG: hypothetical protein IPI67_28165 [Myxococcales bacterium]|nr:hypothetical protein [Myxococcales bacterium]
MTDGKRGIRRWLRPVRWLVAAGLIGAVVSSSGACADCKPGTCECADGEVMRVDSAPCQCRQSCADHGGVCADDYAGCPIDAGDAGADTNDADGWPFPFDAPSG